MPSPLSFRPASYHKGKVCFVAYHSTDPASGEMKRIRIKVNHVRKASERERYARAICDEINRKLYAGWNPFVEKLNATSVTLSKAIELFLQDKGKHARKSTFRSYQSYCSIFGEWAARKGVGGKICALIDADTVRSFVEDTDREKMPSARTYNNYCSFLYTLFDWMRRKKHISSNPAEGLEKRRTDRKIRTTIPPEDRKRIKDHFLESAPRYYYVMQMCYRLFVRPNEIVQLRIRDIDLDEGLLRIPARVAKNHNERIVALPPELAEYFSTLSSYPDHYYIFADRHTYEPGERKIAPTRIAETWKNMRDKLKLPASYQFYSLKDTGITEMLEAGAPAKYVKELADHHSLEMTERYTHKSEAKKILEWNRMEF